LPYSTGLQPPTSGPSPAFWRRLRDPRGRTCWVFVVPDPNGQLTPRFTGFAWEARVWDHPLSRLPVNWWDSDTWPDFALWESCCPAWPQEKLADLVDLNDRDVLSHYVQYPKYRKVLDAYGPGGWTPLFRAAVGGNAQSASVLIGHGADPYTPCFYDQFTETNAVDVALGRAVFIQPDWVMFAELMMFETIREEDVQWAHHLARSFRRQPLIRAEVRQAIDSIDEVMVRKQIQPLGSGARW
jgi:hypothetical protein